MENSFQLDKDFVKKYYNVESPYKNNPLGWFVYQRTYSRVKEDGRNENWIETVERVVNGTYSMQKRWVESHGLGWDDAKGQKSAQEMFDRIFHIKFTPPGRGLWAMGSKIVEQKSIYTALNNCAFISTENIDTIVNEKGEWEPSRPFKFLMDVSMLGVGCGFDVLGAGKIEVHNPKKFEEYKIDDEDVQIIHKPNPKKKAVLDKYSEYLKTQIKKTEDRLKNEKNEWVKKDLQNSLNNYAHELGWVGSLDPRGIQIYEIEDTREGWVESVGRLINSYLKPNQYPYIFDYSSIRPPGILLKTFGGYSSGPEPLLDLHIDIRKVLSKNAGWNLSERSIADLMNLEGKCVVAGNIRRSLPKGTLIHTNAGLVPIEEVLPGMKAITSQGEYSITDLIIEGKQELITIRHQLGEVKCTENHRMAVMRGADGFNFKYAGDIRPGDKLVFSRHVLRGEVTHLPFATSDIITVPKLDGHLAWFFGRYFNGLVNWIDVESRNNPDIISLENSKYHSSHNLQYCRQKTECELLATINGIKCFNLTSCSDIIEQLDRFGPKSYSVSSIRNVHIIKFRDDLSTYFSQFINTSHITIPEFITRGSVNIRKCFLNGAKYAHGGGQRDFSKQIQCLYASIGIFPGEDIDNSSLYTKEPLKPVEVLEVDFRPESVETYDITVETSNYFAIDQGIISHNSAEIALGPYNSEEFINLKNYEKNPERAAFGWCSNNSIYGKIGMDYSDIAQRIKNNGEPGVFWLDNAREYSRMNGEKTYKDMRASGTNPSLRAGTKVYTSDGIHPIEKLEDKDIYVLNLYGKKSKAKCFLSGKNKQLWKITLYGGIEYYCTDEHKWPVFEGTFFTHIRKYTTDNLSEGMKLKRRSTYLKDITLLKNVIYKLLKKISEMTTKEKEWIVESLGFSGYNAYIFMDTLYVSRELASAIEGLYVTPPQYEIDPKLDSEYIEIIDVRPTDIYEDVWDITVFDDSHCFQLAHCITGNCSEQTLEHAEMCCVSGDTRIQTRYGCPRIKDVIGKKVEVWNGKSWSKTMPFIAGYGKKLYRVYLSDGSWLDCTDDHRWQLIDDDSMPCKKDSSDNTLDGSNLNSDVDVDKNSKMEADANTSSEPDLMDTSDSIKQIPYYTSSTLTRDLSHDDRVMPFMMYPVVDSELNIIPKPSGAVESVPEVMFSASPEAIMAYIDDCGSNGRYKCRNDCTLDMQILLRRAGINRCIVDPIDENYSILHIGGKPSVQYIREVAELPGEHTVYCFNESERHMGVFNNVLTYQCLVEVFPTRHEDKDDFLRTLKFAYLYAKTVTLGHSHWPETNRVMMRNRRIGCSLSGLAEFVDSYGINTCKDWLQSGYDTIQYWDKIYSEYLAVPRSIKTTSIKPSGCLSIDTRLITTNADGSIDQVMTLDDIFRANGYDLTFYQTSRCRWLEPKKKLYVRNKDNKPEQITALYINGINIFYEIPLANGEKIRCTPQHKFLVVEKSGSQAVWKRADEIKAGDKIQTV